MKKRYPFVPKNWLRLSMAAAFTYAFTSDLQAQTPAPAIQWDKTLGGDFDDLLTSIKPTADGGYILTGQSTSGVSGEKTNAGQGDLDFWIVKVDSAGNKQWDKTMGTWMKDYVRTVVQTPDGGYLVGGYAPTTSSDRSAPTYGQEDFWLIKLDANGNTLWNKSYGGGGSENLIRILPTADGGYLLAGNSSSGATGIKTTPGRGTYDFWIVKIDAAGTKLWDKGYGGNRVDFLYVVKQTADGGYILGGTSASEATGDKSEPSKSNASNYDDYWVIKIDATGTKQWDKTIGSSWGSEFLYAIEQTADGGYLLGGTSGGSTPNGDKTQPTHGTTGASDFWMVKLNATGAKVWDKCIGGTNGEIFRDMKKTSDGNYILAGESWSPISGDKTEAPTAATDYWIVKIDPAGKVIWDKSIGAAGYDEFGEIHQTADDGFILGGTSSGGIGVHKTEASRGGKDFWIVKLGPQVVTGIHNSEISPAVSLFPNPNQGKFKIQLNNLTSSKAEITISDLLDRQVFTQEFRTNHNQLSEEINLPNAKGIYLLQLKTGAQLFTRKIVVE